MKIYEAKMEYRPKTNTYDSNKKNSITLRVLSSSIGLALKKVEEYGIEFYDLINDYEIISISELMQEVVI